MIEWLKVKKLTVKASIRTFRFGKNTRKERFMADFVLDVDLEFY